MRTFALATALALCLAAPAVRAEPPPPATAADASREKEAGDAAMDQLRFDEALAHYERAHAIAPSPVLLYNRGRALQALGRYPEALDQLEAFARTAPADLKQKVPALDALVAEVRGRVCTLTVESSAAGARVLVGSTVMGNTPLAPLRVNAGKATIVVEAEGYEPFRQEVTLPGGGTATVRADLVLRDVDATLVVNTARPGAEVWLDGHRIGMTPAEARARAGEHRLRVHHPDFVDAESTVVLSPQERKVMDVPLAARPTPSRWWLWTTIGVVVAGAAVAVGVGLSTRPADRATYRRARSGPRGSPCTSEGRYAG
jgi:hypothetical protein